MKASVLVLNLLLFAIFYAGGASAQTDYADAMRKEHWNGGFYVSGGTGLLQRTNVQMVRFGGRVGRVMTGEIAHGRLRHTFELAAEINPVDYTLWSGYKNVYGLSMTPVIMKWNFVGEHPKRVVPFAEIAGGVLFTRVNIPPGDTSKINFEPGGGFGVQIFTKQRQSITLNCRAVHISSASLGNHNPGVNASIQFYGGYTWWKK